MSVFQVGDPIEAGSIANMYEGNRRVPIGSVKVSQQQQKTHPGLESRHVLHTTSMCAASARISQHAHARESSPSIDGSA